MSIYKFNTEPLMKEIETVINKGLSTILCDFVDRYELLEKTHHKILELISVSTTDQIENADTSFSHSKTIQEDSSILDNKIENLENKYNFIYKLLDKVVNKMDLLTNELQNLKIVSTLPTESEKENIKLEMTEEAIPIDNTEEVEVEEVEEEEEEEVEEEEELEEEEKSEEQQVEVKNGEHEKNDDDDMDTEKEEEEEVEELEELEETTGEDEVEEEEQQAEVEVKEVVSEALEEEEEEEYIEIDIDDITYCTNNEDNGFIYELNDGELGVKVGYLKEGEPFFYADEK